MKTIRWGFQEAGLYVNGWHLWIDVIHHEPLRAGERWTPDELCHATIEYRQGLSSAQRNHIEMSHMSNLRPLTDKTHHDSILRGCAVTLEMQANAELAVAVELNGETAEEHQLTDEEVAHPDFLPEQWQGRCPFSEGA